jgi:hypothetical protein
MNTFERLSKNKGTVSSALGKSLAREVLNAGRHDILLECIDLVTYESSAAGSRHIRAGAAKVIEVVAEEKPELVAPHLGRLLPALSVQEPQTRWAIIRVMGFCAHLNRPVAQKAIAFAEKYLSSKEGLVIASSADLFLGDFGSLSRKDAAAIFPILERSMKNVVTNEQDWLLESLLKVFPNLGKAAQDQAIKFAKRWQSASRKSTQQRAHKILRLAQ